MLACGENSCFFSLLGLHQGMFCLAKGEERRLFSKGKLMPPLDTPGTQPPFFDVLVAVASCGLLAYLPWRSRGCMNKYHRRAVRMEHWYEKRGVLSRKHRLCYHSLSTGHFPFQEASSINKSLSALGNVIMALVDITHGKTRHVHYRDSKLTFLLRVSSFCCLCKNPLPLTNRGSVSYSSHLGSHLIKWPWLFKLFLGEQRRIPK